MSFDIGAVCPWLSQEFVTSVNNHLTSIACIDTRAHKLSELVWHIQKIDVAGLSGKEFARMSADELMNLTGDDVLTEKKFENYNMLVTKEFIIDGGPTITCKNCGGAVQWEVRQTRRADEGSTIFVSCTPCDTRWKL